MQVAAGYVLHVGRCTGTLSVGDIVTATIDKERRDLILPNHTFTHVLNFALREVSISVVTPLLHCKPDHAIALKLVWMYIIGKTMYCQLLERGMSASGWTAACINDACPACSMEATVL